MLPFSLHSLTLEELSQTFTSSSKEVRKWTKDGAAFRGDENSCDDETSENVHSKVRLYAS